MQFSYFFTFSQCKKILKFKQYLCISSIREWWIHAWRPLINDDVTKRKRFQATQMEIEVYEVVFSCEEADQAVQGPDLFYQRRGSDYERCKTPDDHNIIRILLLGLKQDVALYLSRFCLCIFTISVIINNWMLSVC